MNREDIGALKAITGECRGPSATCQLSCHVVFAYGFDLLGVRHTVALKPTTYRPRSQSYAWTSASVSPAARVSPFRNSVSVVFITRFKCGGELRVQLQIILERPVQYPDEHLRQAVTHRPER